MPLEEESKDLTTFLTPWGRFRYRVSPQGQKVDGDSYTFRFDLITRDLEKYARIVDDSCLWESDFVKHILDVCSFLTLTANHGIIHNPKKLQLAKRELEFVGFWLKEDGIRPADSIIKAINDFPRPENISGVRSWFGLVEQCVYSFTKTVTMAPFRHLTEFGSSHRPDT